MILRMPGTRLFYAEFTAECTATTAEFWCP